ncbi:MAG: orotate phosphoribosyltransferase [bacterium]
MSIEMKYRLIELVIEKAFKYSEEPVFRLVSGRVSNYYFNCKAVTLHPEGMHIIGTLIYDMIADKKVHAIGGLTLGADPIAYAVAYTSYVKKNPVEAFVVRKSAKSHGTMQWIEGNVKAGDRVVVVDDVITTGKSTIEAITRAQEAGLVIVDVIALIDRQEGGREAIQDSGVNVRSVLTRDEVMEVYRKTS